MVERMSIGAYGFVENNPMIPEGKATITICPNEQTGAVHIGFAVSKKIIGIGYPVSEAREFAHKVLEACNVIEFGGKWEGD